MIYNTDMFLLLFLVFEPIAKVTTNLNRDSKKLQLAMQQSKLKKGCQSLACSFYLKKKLIPSITSMLIPWVLASEEAINIK